MALVGLFPKLDILLGIPMHALVSDRVTLIPEHVQKGRVHGLTNVFNEEGLS